MQSRSNVIRVTLRLWSLGDHVLLVACLADLVGAYPFALDRPGSKALMVRVVTSEMAVLNETTASMPATKMDHLELHRMSDRYAKLRLEGART